MFKKLFYVIGTEEISRLTGLQPHQLFRLMTEIDHPFLVKNGQWQCSKLRLYRWRKKYAKIIDELRQQEPSHPIKSKKTQQNLTRWEKHI